MIFLCLSISSCFFYWRKSTRAGGVTQVEFGLWRFESPVKKVLRYFERHSRLGHLVQQRRNVRLTCLYWQWLKRTWGGVFLMAIAWCSKKPPTNSPIVHYRSRICGCLSLCLSSYLVQTNVKGGKMWGRREALWQYYQQSISKTHFLRDVSPLMLEFIFYETKLMMER